MNQLSCSVARVKLGKPENGTINLSIWKIVGRTLLAFILGIIFGVWFAMVLIDWIKEAEEIAREP